MPSGGTVSLRAPAAGSSSRRRQPVSDLVLWLVRYGSYESLIGSALRLIAWLRRRLRGRPAAEPEKEDEAASSDASGDARADAVMKRVYAAAGLLGIYVTWTIMSWCVTLCMRPAELLSRHAMRAARRFICAPSQNGYRGPLARADASALFITLPQSPTAC